MINVSVRNSVGTGPDVLIAGFTISGSGTKNLLIRGIGPGLSPFGVRGALADPVLQVFDATSTTVAANDNWSTLLAPVFASVGAFPLSAGSKDAAAVMTLRLGGYSVLVSSADGGTGEALVEIYELP